MNLRLSLICIVAGALGACGGGGGGSGPSSGNGGPQPTAGDRVSLSATNSVALVPSVTNTDLDFFVTNPSTSAANGVALTVALADGLTRAGVECTATGGATCPSDRSTMSVATLPGGATLHFRMSVIVAAGMSGTLSSTGTVVASNDNVSNNNSASVAITAYSADLNVIGATDATEFFSGNSVPYSLTVSNAGPDAALDVELQNALSSGQTLIALTCEASGGAICPTATGPVMTIPILPSGGSLTFAVTAQLSMDVIVSVSTTFRATSRGDASLSNNTATVSAKTRIPTSTNSPSFVMLQSDTGDYVGGGRNYSYTRENAVIELYKQDERLVVKVTGDEKWSGDFYMPSHLGQIEPGTYTDLRGTHDAATGGMVWRGEARACSANTNWFEVDEVVYAAGEIASIDLRFEQHCSGMAPALRGQIHWVAGDETRPPGPVNPPPVGLWEPAPGVTPASGNYVYIQSDPGDFIGQGRTETYTQANSILQVSLDSGVLQIGMTGDRSYGAHFKAMSPLTRIEPGYYPNAQGWPFGNPAVGLLSFLGDGRGCNGMGWFVIDSMAISGDELIALDMRFQQQCGIDAAALRGKIHWRADDTTQPQGPQVPPPAGLWVPPAGAVPATGNVVYLESDAGDYIGGGLTAVYTPLDSVIDVNGAGFSTAGNRFQLTVTGNEEWTGYFQAMSTLPDLQAGYYGNLLGFPWHNPATGGISWYGEGRGCNKASGWFVIDSVTYSGGALTAIELRFEQHCEFRTAAMRGMIRWSAADTRQPTGPVNPIPMNLWTPPIGATPATGNYFYQVSEAGEFIGQGQTYLYTPLDAVFQLSAAGNQLNIEVYGDERWSGYVIPMVPLTQLEVGYYDLPRGNNIAKGQISWHGQGRACGANAAGWFAIDEVTYNAASLASINMRFEFRCSATAPALRGKLHWRADDPT
jgi:uncharacterized repeat protein (TIGR01451 family)